MSIPSTPKRLNTTSPVITPSNEDIASPLDQLTPRSKLKALLASVDDSDDETPRLLSRRSESKSSGITHTVKDQNTRTREENEDSGVNTSGDEDNEDVVVPRGRLAARLHGQTTAFPKESRKESSVTPRTEEHIEGKQLESKVLIEEAATDAVSVESEQGSTKNRRSLGGRKKSRARSDGDESPAKSLLLHSASPRLPLSPNASGGYHSTCLSPSTSPRINVNDSVLNESDDSDADIPLNPAANARFLELVARKKAERQARDAAEKKERQERTARLEAQSISRRREILNEGISEDDSSDQDGVARKLTQQSRPMRKASKKAMEEMNRETQRMSRNMQLAHQAKTRKKISKDSLLSRFKFRSISGVAIDAIQATSSSIRGSSEPPSDAEGSKARDTPPTSPASPVDELPKPASVRAVREREDAANELEVEDDLPSIEDVMNQPLQRLDKGKARAVDSSLPEPIEKKSSKGFLDLPAIRIKPPKSTIHRGPPHEGDSDSDLEIVAPASNRKANRLAIFDRLPGQNVTEARSLQTLRALAHLTSPNKQESVAKKSITPSEMQISLQTRARQQAAKERAEKIKDLKDRGIIIQTAEERERDQADVEDLLEKARREVEEIGRKEKDAMKKERRKNGQDELSDSSDEDEDYQDVEDEVPEVEVSGSDDEGGDEVDESNEEHEDEDLDEDSGGAALHNGIEGLIDVVASEGSDEEDRREDEEEIDEELEVEPRRVRTNRRKRISHILDEEDEDDDRDPSKSIESLRIPFIPNLNGANNIPMGLTQAFEATMAESQSQPLTDLGDEEQDSLAFLRNMPAPDFPVLDVEDSMVPNSQPTPSQAIDQENDGLEEISLHFSQSQIHHNAFASATQYSDIPDPTQDTGFKAFSPVLNRFVSVPPSTEDTIVIPKEREDKPIVKKKGRLRRRVEADLSPNEDNMDGEAGNAEDDNLEITANAFDILKQASKKPAAGIGPFDKKKSDAKGMVEEQAEESEDEYAGLGGASDDGSGGEEDEEVKKMIDEGEVKVDERKLAAFFADKERAMDEKAVEKLFKDINSGGLRRKRGADFSLSDSEDDHEARQRRKRQEFQKMRKALLENENVGKIAEDPKKKAFLRAIEDREDDEDLDFLEQPTGSQDESQSQSQDTIGLRPVAASVEEPEMTGAKRKRVLQDSLPDAANRPPPHARRTQQKTKRPSTLAEIRESVSFLLEDPDSMPPDAHSYSSEDDNDKSDHPNEPQINQDQSSFSSRRVKNPIIDRISLKRAESAQSASAATGSARMAFHDPNSSLQTGFKVPSLLRRATTQNTVVGGAADSNGISHGIVGTERAIGGEKAATRMGGTKKSSVNWFAREEERRARLKTGGEGDLRRKMSGNGNGRGGLGGLLGRGGFE